ncbi:T9SS type A sorting domain-containing protein [Flavobacterium sandaracinum]|uniref:T9SS type A sorting domain-containing protein n=1 Tax=Flavobacterium sandaracinum TaxID=2541733 RepID=A0A4R5D5W0_9FLAO|nr:T9SS type A sorting domain-containing protein [Flavobacterium sandaracinum]TDE07230.1 T9SS type A sorting domain-containing protein [Flavobacterium sandaracinum]
MRYLLIFFTVTFHGQVLHHQMLSSQGVSKILSDGTVISQTIGQQSLNGTSNKDYVVMQGFQQSFWGKYIALNTVETIKTITFPNPFIQTVNFEFSKVITEDIHITVFDLGGRLVFEQTKKADDLVLTITLPFLPSSEYLVRLNTSSFTHFTKIIKI